MDLEKRFAKEKYRHLTEEELDSYYDQSLNPMARALADAHLRVCLICENKLKEIQEDHIITDEDVALVRRAMQEMGLMPSSTAGQDRLDEDLQELAENWWAFFSQQEFVHGVHRGDEPVWEAQTKDDHMKAYADMGRDGSLTIHFSSGDLSLEGKRFSVSIGAMHEEVTLERVSASEVYAKVGVTKYEIPIEVRKIKFKQVS